MNDIHTHAQLHQSGRGRILLALVELTAEDPHHFASHRGIAEQFGITERDALYELNKLRTADLAVPNDRASGGWRPTPEGARIAAGLQASLEDGELRLEHTMRTILANIKLAGGDVTRDDWTSWDLHEEGRAPVSVDDREHALDLLREAEYVKSLNALQASHLRVEITSRGRARLGRPGDTLMGGMFDHGQTTTFDQRVGIQAETFHNNGGAVQTGDHTVQNITITNAQAEQVHGAITATRQALAQGDLDAAVRIEVSAVVDEIEAAAAQHAETGVLAQLITKATMAAAGSAGSATGGALIQSLGGGTESRHRKSCCSGVDPTLDDLGRCAVPDRGMHPLPIIVQLDPTGDIINRPPVSGIHHAMNPLDLQGRVERLRPRVVVADTSPTHGTDYTVSFTKNSEFI